MSPGTIGEWFPTFGRIGKRLFAILKPIGKGLLVFVIVLAVIHSIATFILGRRLEAQIAAIKARGEPVTWADLPGETIPDAENAAVVYAKAFELIASPAAQEDLSTLGKFLSPKERKDKPVSWDEAESAVARLSRVMPLIEQAVSRPKCQFPVDWEADVGLRVAHFWWLRDLDRFLLANAKLAVRDGRMDEAVRSLDLAYKVGESVKDGPTVIAQMVRVAMIKRAGHSLRETLRYGHINESQARRLYNTLGNIDMSPGFVKAMQGERVCGLCAFERARKYGGQGLQDLISHRDGWRFPPILLGYPWRPFLYADESVYLDLMNAAVDSAALPFRERQGKGLDQPVDFPSYALLSKTISPVFFAKMRARTDEAVAEVAGSRIFLALHTYHHRFHLYPETLDELKTKLGWKLPGDPFSGKDFFVYKRQKKGFLLYSIGPDLKDDGGVRLGPTRDPVAKGDIVWKLER